MADETRRWLDGDLPDELRDVLASAASDSADAESLGRLRAGLEASLGPAAWNMRAPSAATPNDAAGASGQSSAGAALGAKLSTTPVIALGVSTMLALGIGGLMLRDARTDEPAPAHTVQHAPLQPSAAGVPAPAPELAAPIDSGAHTSAAAPRTRAAAARNEPSLSEELKGLERIRQAMGAPNRALVSIERQARRFPSGALVPERELLQLEALYKAGQTARAEQLAARLTSEAARHPYRAQALQLHNTFAPPATTHP